MQRAIRADGRRRTHGSDDYDRPIVFDCEVEKKGGLLKRVRTVGDNNSGDLRIAAENSVDAVGESEPVRNRDVGAIDVHNLLNLYIGQFLDFRHGLYQIFTTQGPALVIRQVR